MVYVVIRQVNFCLISSVPKQSVVAHVAGDSSQKAPGKEAASQVASSNATAGATAMTEAAESTI